MCGIAGIIQTNSSNFHQQHIKIMTDVLAHRGPDGEGFWQNDNGSVLLGHRRLSIIDLSNAGKQPMHYLNRYVIIHNGEIYNYTELRELLIKKGYAFQSKTDTEVIVAAYDHWKELCVDQFDGMFAFAIWDEKEKKLFAARDRFGEKPFYYSYNGNSFVFASEMKALWAAGIERNPNLRMLFNFITIGYTDNPTQPSETFFENIYKLPAATTLTFDINQNELVLEKYWDIDAESINKKITDKEAIEQFDHLFTSSVQRRLRSDVSIGTSLSGGLDSSSIIAAAYPFIKSDLSFKAFTAVFPGFEKNEQDFSKQIADKFKLHPFTTNPSSPELLNDWDKLIYHQEEPFGSASIYAQFKVYELAQQQDVKVLLDGQGADEILAGYTKYYKWYWQELYRKRKLKKSNEVKDANNLGVNEKFNFKNIIASYFPDFATIVMEQQYLLKALQQEDLTKDFIKLQSKEAYYTTPAHFTLNGALYFNTITHGLEELLRYADRNSMAFGREVRLPFLNHELVEFVFSLPAHFKIRQGWTKWLLRNSMEKSLPTEITWRRDKVGFEPPQLQWMQDKNLQELIQESKRNLVKKNILKETVLDKSIIPKSSHEADNFDWRYLTASVLFK